jgi:hypothetical protein
MPYPAVEGNICPCCGTEFGYDDDLGVTYRQIRDNWLEQGAPWFSPVDPQPDDWNAIAQLVASEYEFSPPSWWELPSAPLRIRMEGPLIAEFELALAS